MGITEAFSLAMAAALILFLLGISSRNLMGPGSRSKGL